MYVYGPLIETPAVDKITMGSRVCETKEKGSIQNVLCRDRVEKLCSQLNRKIREKERGEREIWKHRRSLTLFLLVYDDFLALSTGQILQIDLQIFHVAATQLTSCFDRLGVFIHSFDFLWACFISNRPIYPWFPRVRSSRHDTHPVYVITRRICNGTCARAHAAAAECRHVIRIFLELRLDSKPSVTFIMREYLAKRLTSLSSTSALFRQMHLFFRAGHEYFRAEWHIQWRMKRERQWGGGGRRSREVWVIKFGFCRSHKALQISIRLPHSWPSLLISSVIAPAALPLPVCRYVILQVYD